MCRILREPEDTTRLRQALGRFPTGVAIVTTRTKEGERVGLTINSFSSISMLPPLVAWCIDRRARSYSAFRWSDRFAVTVLAADQTELARRFATAGADKFRDVSDDLKQSPIIPGGAAWFECAVYRTISLGDHLMHVGQVTAFESSRREPLLFAQGSFQHLPDAPRNAA
jgi:3-hydroxy-9,10-secoandrosta-1,3,5(10)-triene-9,17-dione monooxygenase reductase component